jgi:hypothetical protein
LSQTPHDVVAVGGAGRVAVFRHAPHALDRRIAGHQALDLGHVRTVVIDGNGEHLDAVVLANRKVAVVTGAGADELYFAAAPRFLATRHPVQQRAHHGVVHHRQARGTADHDLCRRSTQHVGEDRLHFGQAVEAAVVAPVAAVAAFVVSFAERDRQFGGQVELLGRRLAASHVQLQALGFERVVTLLELLREGCTF